MKMYWSYSAKLLAVLLVICINQSSCNVHRNCKSFDNAFTYNYESQIEVKLDDKLPASSLYKLKGKLNVYGSFNAERDQCLRFELQDIKYYPSSGKISEQNEILGEYFADVENFGLSKYFNAYYVNGTFEKMFVRNNEHDWSINMKKSLANNFQIPPLSAFDSDESFSALEDSLYGLCKPEYSFAKTNNGWSFKKVYFTHMCKNTPHVHSLDVEDTLQQTSNDDFQEFSGIKEYQINTVKFNQPVISSLTTKEMLRNSKFGNSNEKWQIISSQKIVLSNKPAREIDEENMVLEKGDVKEINDLKYTQKSSDNAFGLLSIANGRTKFNGNFIEMAKQKLNEVVEYLTKNNLGQDLRHIHQQNSVTELLMVMRYLNTEEIESLYQSSANSVTKKQILINIIPKIGTRSAVKFVINLISNDDSDDIAEPEDMVMDLPFFVLNYTRDLLNDAEHLLHLPKHTKSDLKTTATLAYSIMFSKLCGGNDHSGFACDAEFINKKTDFFFNTIIENQNSYFKQLVYLEGLKNLNTIPAINYLEKIISGKDLRLKNELRLRAMIGPNPISLYPSKVQKIFIPILANNSETVEIRAAALQMVLDSQLAFPDRNQFSLHWHMVNEKSSQIYDHYYSLLKSFADSENPQHQNKKSAAKKILQISRKPSGSSFENMAKIYNFINKESGDGIEFVVKTFGDGSRAIPSLIYGEYNTVSNFYTSNVFGVHIRTTGFLDSILQKTIDRLSASSNLFDYDFKREIVQSKPSHAEVIVQTKGYTLSVSCFGDSCNMKEESIENDSSHVDRLMNKYKDTMQKLQKMSEQLILFYDMADRVYMTDLGVPVLFSKHFPQVSSVTGKYNRESKLLDFDFRISSVSRTNLLAFNPVVNSWHGVSKVDSFDFVLPVSMSFEFDYKDDIYLMSFQKTDGDGHMGLQYKTDTYAGHFDGNSVYPTNLTLVREYENEEDSYNFVSSNLKSLGYNLTIASNGCNNEQTPKYDHLNSFNGFFKSFFLFYRPSAPKCSALRVYAYPTENDSSPKFSFGIKVSGSEIGGKIPLYGFTANVKAKIQMISGSNEVTEFLVDSDVTSSPNGVKTELNSKITCSVNGNPNGGPMVFSYEKTYPAIGADAFKYGWGDESVSTKFAVKQCESEDLDKCASMSLNVKGEISDEQKQIASSDVYPYNKCESDKKLPEWQGPLYPRSWPCFEGAIKLFLTRKITLEMASDESFNYGVFSNLVSHSNFITLFKHYLSNVQELPQGNPELKKNQIKMVAIHNVNKPTIDIDYHSHVGSYKFRDVPGIDRDIYNLQLDSTHFSKFLMVLQATAFDRSCLANSVSILTPDNATVPHQFGSQYEALTKLTSSNKYGVFLKKGDSGLVLKFVVGDATVEVSGTTATLNGKPINIEKGYQYPESQSVFYFRILSNQGQVTVYSRTFGFYIIYSPVSVTLDQPIVLKGFVDGLCGNLA